MYFVRKKVSTIYNGIQYETLPPRTAPKGRETHILTVAELHRNKGLMYGLRAIENLYKNNHLVRYTVFGEGEERKELEKYIAMKDLGHIVTLRGHDSKLHDEWCNYDLFLLPSIKEGLPYVLIEAGLAALPVVTTTTGGIPEIIRHEETGLLVYPKDVVSLTKELERLVKDRKFAKTLGQTLHSHVVQYFSFSKMIVETSKIYGLIDKVGLDQLTTGHSRDSSYT
jgi:L-malate glycosyltransferase